MKLRFRGNSLRLRVNQREVTFLAGGEPVEERVAFPGGKCLVYRLVPSKTSTYGATLAGSTIDVSVPSAALKQWEQDAEIGLYYQDELLSIAIEKDLECTEGSPEERDPHAFPRKVAC
jgi:hypothetical protein